MKLLLTLLTSIFALTALGQGPVLRTPYTTNTATIATNIVREIATNSTIHAGKLAAGGTLPALNGSAVTSLNGTAIASGTVADARLSSNVALESAANVFSASNYIAAAMIDDLTVQNNIVGAGNISANGLIGDPSFTTVSLDTSTGDFRTLGSIYVDSAAEFFSGNGAGISNLQSANLVGALPAIDGSQLTGITGGSGTTLSQVTAIIETNSTTFTFSDGTSIAKSNLVVFVGGDSRTQTNQNVTLVTNQWHVQLTNSPAWRGIKALVSITTGGGLGFGNFTNGWALVGLPWYSNNVATDTDDVYLLLDASGRNDQINGQGLGGVGLLTNSAAYYIACKSNFYATAIKPLGIRVASIMLDPTDLYSGQSDVVSSGSGRFNFNKWVAMNTNVIDYPLNFWKATPNNWDTNVYYDAIHLADLGNRLWMQEADEAVRLRRNRPLVDGWYVEGTNTLLRSTITGLLVNRLKGNYWDKVWAYRADNAAPGTGADPDPATPGFFTAGATTVPAMVVRAAASHNAAISAFEVQSSDGGGIFKIFPDGHIQILAGGSLINGNMQVYGGSQPYFQVNNTSFKAYRLYSRDDSSFVIRDETAGVDRFIITTAGSTAVAGTLKTGGTITNQTALWLVGTGSPEGVDVAPIGSIKSRTDGSTDTALYRKETGTGNTGWVAVSAGAAGGGTNTFYPDTDPDLRIILGGGNSYFRIFDAAGAQTGELTENGNFTIPGNMVVAGGSLTVTNQAEAGTDYELAVFDETGTLVRAPGTGVSLAEINATTINGTNINFYGNANIRTNIAQFDVDATAFVVGTRYTNSNRRSFVTASFTLNGAAAGTAAVTLSAEQAGVTNMVKIAAGPLASLTTIEQLSLMVGPGAFYYFTDATTGTGASVAIVTGTSSRTDL